MNNKLSISLFVLSLSLLAACGKGDSGKSSGGLATVQALEAQGNYRAIIRPFNNHLSGFLPTGFADISISGDTVTIKTMLDDDARVIHMQNIHANTRCPNAGDDTNGDGYVDINEAYAVVGQALVPLDSDLNTKTLGAGLYPLGGGFTYSESASLKKLEADVKARTGQNLNLEGRVVLMHGVDANTKVPTTFGTLEGMPQQASAPIACGILKRR